LPADYYKLVTTAKHQSDNCAVLEFLDFTSRKLAERNWIAFCMGETGIPSRVLAMSRGASFIYASISPSVRSEGGFQDEVAAPGQLDWDTLKNLYRADRIKPSASIYGLVGNPVRQSIGPAVHNAAFQTCGLDAVYVPLLITNLEDLRKAVPAYPLAGFSVTIPHKEKIARWIDRIDRRARDAGAINTVRIRRGRWEATNTDVEGICVPLRKTLRLSHQQYLPPEFRAAIVGNGGAARAAVVALRELRCREIAFAGRNLRKVRRFAQAMNARALTLEGLEREHVNLLVHATPVGMWPDTDAAVLQPEQINADLVFDLIYNPPQTRLLQMAQRRGCHTISGLEMFLAQAALQFEFWTGRAAPASRMRRAALQQLEGFPHNTEGRISRRR
jgi:3-dehydroquinate dehydratase/shikimate dehydrogenase